MSDAAERYVQACTQPKVKGATLALFKAIAEYVPDGQTTTPPISLEDLAVRARIKSDRTARTCRDTLVDLREVKVHDGGQGKPARFELLHLTEGERPLTEAPLPLIGRPTPRRTKEQRSTSAISTDVPLPFEAPAATVFADVAAYFGNFYRSWLSRTKEQRSTSVIFTEVPETASIDRARDVHTTDRTERDTVAAQAAGPTDAEIATWPPDKMLTPEEAVAFDAWWARTYPSLGADPASSPPVAVHPWHAWCGRVCVPTSLHQEFLRKGHTAAWLVAFYTRRCAAIPPGEKIAVDDFRFWRAAVQDALRTTAAPTTRGPSTSYVRHEGTPRGTLCPHDPRCATIRDCIDRTLTEAREARKQA